MATVGSLFINVKARTAGFSKKMMGVRSTITRMAKGFGRLAMKVGKFAAILGGVALVAIIAFTVKGLKAVDTMAKLAQNIGSSIKSIQVLRHMATLGGVSIEKMDKAIAKMTRGVGETLVFGVGEASDAIRELGLKAEDLEKLSPEKMFGVIADSINRVTNSQRAGILAYKMFGRAGQELIVTMKDGSAGVDAMSKKLEELGVVIGDKQSQMVEKANDAWADIGLVWSSLGNQLAVEFAPILTTIANKIIEFVKNAGGMGKVAEWVVKAFFYLGAAVLDVIRAITIGWQSYKWAVLQVWAGVLSGASWVVNKIETLMHGFFTLTLKTASVTGGVLSWLAENASRGLDAMGANTIASILKTASVVTKTFGHVFGIMGDLDTKVDRSASDWLKEMGISLQTQADETADDLLKTLSEGWNLDKVPGFFKSLRENMMGEGFDLGAAGQIEMVSPDMKGAVESLQTAIGGFKVEGDGQTRLLENTLNVEKKHLQTSKEILAAVSTNGGGALQ